MYICHNKAGFQLFFSWWIPDHLPVKNVKLHFQNVEIPLFADRYPQRTTCLSVFISALFATNQFIRWHFEKELAVTTVLLVLLQDTNRED